MELNVPQNAIIFYSRIFEWVTFDILHTDLIYGFILKFVDDSAYSDKVD